MTRLWTELLADLADLSPGGVPTVFLATVVLTVLVVLLWYFFPSWLPPYHWNSRRERRRGGRANPRTGFRWRAGHLRWRWRRRRRTARPAAVDDAYAADELPDLPAAQLTLTADQLAAAGRFAEAVRERLRAMVRDLIEREVLPPTPGWTVIELAVAATARRPALAGPMRAAVDVFSEIWYGLRPATAHDDQAMRAYAATVGQVARESAPVPASTARAR